MIKLLPIVDALRQTSHMAEARKRIEEWEIDEDVNADATIGEDVHKFLRKYERKRRRQAASK